MQKKTTLILSYLLPRIQDAIFVVMLIAVFVHGPAMLNVDGDLGRHVTIGNYIFNNWEIPTRDIFSHTMPGQQLVPHEWLAQLTLGVLHRLWGLIGIVWMIAVLIAGAFTLTYREMLRRNVFRTLALFIVLLAASASSLHWLARPHIFTFLFTALWAYQLENDKSKVWLFPLIMWIWANTHGAFIAGFVIWGAHTAGWFWEYLHKQSTLKVGFRLGLIGAASFAVTFLNPAGWHLWGTSVGYFGSQFLIDRTVEYQSPNFHIWSTWPFLILLALGILALASGGRLRPHESILFAGWMVMSLYSARNIPLFAIIVAPYIGVAVQATVENIPILQKLDQRISGVENGLKGIPWPLLAILVFIISFYTQSNAANQFNPKRLPVDAVDWLETNPQQGNMFNHFTWGGYILYRLWPPETVFIDGQTDFYGESLTREYEQVMYVD
ncbi:MAG: hypothetical protein ACXW4M_10515, partial [Anaerolineales bacterium]